MPLLVPDFVLKLMTPPENLPHSGPTLLYCTLNSEWDPAWHDRGN